MCVCVCVCVCERERERESVCVCVCVCVCEREREREREACHHTFLSLWQCAYLLSRSLSHPLFPCYVLKHLNMRKHTHTHTHPPTFCLTHALFMDSMPYKYPFHSSLFAIMFPSLLVYLAFINLSPFTLMNNNKKNKKTTHTHTHQRSLYQMMAPHDKAKHSS